MTRRIVYGIGLWVFLAATALTLASIALPSWLTYRSPVNVSPNPAHPDSPIRVSYGLHKRCSSLTGSCTTFPQYQDCHGDERHFCSMWRTVGFLMSIAAVIEFAAIVAFAIVLLGGVQKRVQGWRMVVGLLAVIALCQCAAMAIVAYLYDHDDRFFVGWKLDTAWVLCTVSWAVLLLDVAGIASAANLLPPEGDYELIPDRR
ncbi:hypothetical protein H2203_004315 [Taxawa tesnikishii (nom. ined.)]|nr:hypothetical protein H2203_004315 [Dothideales sp. JES 119]